MNTQQIPFRDTNLRWPFWFLILIFAFGCAQKESRQWPDGNLRGGPRNQDTPLDLSSLERSRLPLFKSTQEMRSSEFFELSRDFMKLGDKLGDRDIRKLAHTYMARFYSESSNYTTMNPSEVLYLEAALGEKWDDLQWVVNRRLADIKNSIPKVEEVSRQTKFQLKEPGHLTAAPREIKEFLHAMAGEFHRKKVSAEVVAAFRGRVKNEFLPVLDDFEKTLINLDQAKRLTKMIDSLRRISQSFSKLPLGEPALKSISTQISRAESFSKDIASIQSSVDGVRVLARIWEDCDSSARKSIFSQQASAVYWGFQKLSPAEISDLKQGRGGIKVTSLRWALETGLEWYGVDQFRNQVDSAAAQFIKKQFGSYLKNMVSIFPALIGKTVVEQLKLKVQEIENIKKDERNYFGNLALKWADTEIFNPVKKIPALESPEVELSTEQGRLRIKGLNHKQVDFETESLGHSLTAWVSRWIHIEGIEGISFKSNSFFQMVLSQINKLLLIGGFRDIRKNLIPSLHVALGDQNVIFDVRKIAEEKRTFAVPEKFKMRKPFDVELNEIRQSAPRFGVKAQAALLEGTSSMMAFFRDWEPSGFDSRIKNYRLGDVIPGLSPQLQMKYLFPKDKLFEFSLGLSAVPLMNLKKSYSNLVLFYPDGRTGKGEDLDQVFADLAAGKPDVAVPLSAGLADFDLEARAHVIRGADVARFILALDQFEESLQGYEKSNSALLNDPLKPELKQILEANLNKLPLLRMIFANFISKYLQDADGGFFPAYDVLKKQPFGEKSLEDQIWMIRALIRSSQLLRAPVYTWSAQESYFYMNSKLWDPSVHFYRASENAQTESELRPQVIIQVLLALADLRSGLQGASQVQLETLLESWIQKLKVDLPH